MERPTREQLRQLYDQGPEATIAFIEALFDKFEPVFKQVPLLEARIKTLEDQLAKNSQNSHKPPSSDVFTKQTKSLREPGQRPVGGQKGHKGHTLERIANPDKIKHHSVSHCCNCGVSLDDVAAHDHELRQVLDIPPVKIEVTEHRAEIKACPHCHATSKAGFPAGVTQPVQYGSGIKAQLVYLMNQHLIPYKRACEIISDFYHQTISTGTAFSANQACGKALKQDVEQIKICIVQAEIAHFDESGLRVDGKGRWLHTSGTNRYTYYYVHVKRGKVAMDEIDILPLFTGTAVHDHFKSYFTYDQCTHGLCNSHHLRELNFIIERYEQKWAEKMKDLLLGIKKAVNRAKADGKFGFDKAVIKKFEQQYRDILAEGFKENPEYPCRRKRKKHTKPQNFLRRLEKCQTETLAFMYDFKVPFDNNLAEQDIRMIKVHQKIAGCFRTMDGAKTFCRIRSYISTARKQKRNILECLRNAIEGNPSDLTLSPEQG